MLNGIASGECCERSISVSENTLKNKLLQQKAEYETKLEAIKASLEFIEKNPDFENFMNCLSKVGRL